MTRRRVCFLPAVVELPNGPNDAPFGAIDGLRTCVAKHAWWRGNLLFPVFGGWRATMQPSTDEHVAQHQDTCSLHITQRCCRGPLGLDLLAVLRVEQLKQSGAVPCQLLLRKSGLLLLMLLRAGRCPPLLWLLFLLLGIVMGRWRGLLGHFVVDLRKLTLRLPLF